MIKNIIFDFNGTLIDDVIVSLDSLNFCFHKYVDPNKNIEMDYYMNNFRFPVIDFYKELGFGVSDKEYDDLSNDFIAYYISREKDWKLYPDVIPALRKLKEMGINLFIVTASFKDLIDKQLKDYQIDTYFDAVISQNNKHAKSKLQNAINYFKENPINFDETIMVGDTVHDIEVALGLGVKGIGHSRGHNSTKLLNTITNTVVDNYDQLIDLVVNENKTSGN